MMKIRSKALYEHFLACGALNGTEEDITAAKRGYRRAYQKAWKQRRQQLRKELRIILTLRQLSKIKLRALQCDMTATAYARTTILSSVEGTALIPQKDRLLAILQRVSMASIAAAKNTVPLWNIADELSEAEKLLLDYLTIQNEIL